MTFFVYKDGEGLYVDFRYYCCEVLKICYIAYAIDFTANKLSGYLTAAAFSHGKHRVLDMSNSFRLTISLILILHTHTRAQLVNIENTHFYLEISCVNANIM